MTPKDSKYLLQLGLKLEKLYRSKFESQNQFSEKAGVDNRTIRRIVRGECDPRLTTLKKISDALEISISELIGD